LQIQLTSAVKRVAKDQENPNGLQNIGQLAYYPAGVSNFLLRSIIDLAPLKSKFV
jgi:hypothetical protein